MVQKGIHPLLNTLRVVMRNGASFTIQTTLRRSAPYMLQTDTTNNPIYTGESSGLSLEDARTQRVMSRYEGFVVNDQEEAAVDPAAASPSSSSSSSSSSGGKSKK
ncbi:hypothetical protein D9Q98_000096 [Chlorella vulgaris]|uniref:Large ribosomal subunit protein bL31c n=1 Tax=Chlorella vulgaris TaxID=3077 RepID=A0A9D4TXJ7_CHLVU|nr:hypothetical protein D9Q98_000096 [Chlorella vulgaris]